MRKIQIDSESDRNESSVWASNTYKIEKLAQRIIKNDIFGLKICMIGKLYCVICQKAPSSFYRRSKNCPDLLQQVPIAGHYQDRSNLLKRSQKPES